MNSSIHAITLAVDEASSIIEQASQMIGSSAPLSSSTSCVKDFLTRSHAILQLAINPSFSSMVDASNLSNISLCATYLASMVDDMESQGNRASTALINEMSEQEKSTMKTSTDTGNMIHRELYYNDIVGQITAKQSLKENVVYQFTLPSEIKEKYFTGIRSRGGNVLLYGPPGTGKTMLAQATACEAMAILFAINPSDVLRSVVVLLISFISLHDIYTLTHGTANIKGRVNDTSG